MWIFYTLLAITLWSLANIIDSYLVEKNKKIGHPVGALVLFSSLVAVLVTTVIGIFTPNLFNLKLWQILILLSTGLLNISWIILYLYAIARDSISFVVPWFLMIPFFGYILGNLFLGETLSNHQMVGGLIIILGGLILSVRSFEGKYKINYKTIFYMVPASLFVALWGVLFKIVAHTEGFWVSTFWEHAGLSIAGLLIFIFVKSYREGFKVMLNISHGKIVAVNATSEILAIAGNLLNNFALLLAPIILVYLVSTFQSAITFFVTIIFTIFFPTIYKEDISMRALWHKSISIAIMIAGAIYTLN